MVQGKLIKRHPWWRGDSWRSILPPAGCREEVFWCSRSWKRGGGGTERGEIAKKGSCHGVFTSRRIYGRRGAARGARPQGVHPRARREGAWGLVGPAWPPLGDSRSFFYTDF